MTGIDAIPFIYVKLDDVSRAFSSVRRRRGVLVQLERFVVVPRPVRAVGCGRGLVLLLFRITVYWDLLCSYQAFVLEVRSIASVVEAESVIKKNVFRIMQ